MDGFEEWIDGLKTANPVASVIGETYELRSDGRRLRAIEHDSLVIDPAGGAWFWNSRGLHGDVIDWVRLQERCEFREAVEILARRAGIDAPRWNQEDAQVAAARRSVYDTLRIAARHWVRTLRDCDAALAYCRERGWTDETIRAAGLGYADGDRAALQSELSMHSVAADAPAARAVLGMRSGMLVYPHVAHGQVVYISARSIEGKQHYNLPAALVGERRRYANWHYGPGCDEVVVVEGQADAITLGQWGWAAIALAGTAVDTQLLQRLGQHDTIYVALDQDEAGVTATRKLADALGPMTRVVEWPESIQDANDWLQHGASVDDANELLAAAPTWVEVAANAVRGLRDSRRLDAMRRVFRLVARMDEFQTAVYKERLADAMEIGIREYNRMAKTAAEKADEDADGDPLITIETVGGQIGELLVELLYEPPADAAVGMGNGQGTGRTMFAVRDTEGAISVRNTVDYNGVRYVPFPPESKTISERVVMFPTGLGPDLSVRELIKRIQSTIHRYVDVDLFYESLAAYYVLFSWLYDCFNTVPYLRALGDAGTGKSRLIQVVGALCYRPIFVSGAATVSPIFRIIDAYRGTLILDEGDFGRSDEAADIIKILNTGYQRIQGTVLRSGDRNTGFEPEVFVVYGPKVLATRKRFSDWALESRCLTKEMGGPTTRDDIPIDLPRSFLNDEAPSIRNALLRYRMQHWQPQIELDYSGMDRALEPRLNQVTVALVTLIDDEDLREDVRGFIREYNRQLVVERGMTVEAKALEAMLALRALAAQQAGDAEVHITIGEIAEKVNWLIDWENQGEEMVAQYVGPNRRTKGGVTARKVGSVIRGELHLATERGPAPTRAYEVVWDERRIDGLRKRFGVDDEVLTATMQALFEIEALMDEARSNQHQAEMPM